MKSALFPTILLVLAVGFVTPRVINDKENEISDEVKDYEEIYRNDGIDRDDATERVKVNSQADKWVDVDQIVEFVTEGSSSDDVNEVIDKVMDQGVDFVKDIGVSIIETTGERINKTGNRFGIWGDALHKIGDFLNNVGISVTDISKRIDTMESEDVQTNLKEWKGNAVEHVGNASGMALDFIGDITGQDNLREKVGNASDAIIGTGIFVAKEIRNLIENPQPLADAIGEVIKIAQKVGEDVGQRIENVRDIVHVAGEELAKDIKETVEKHVEKNDTQETIKEMKNIKGILFAAGEELASDIKKTVEKRVNSRETQETIDRLVKVQDIMFEAGGELADDIKKTVEEHVNDETIDEFVSEAKSNAKKLWDQLWD